jgi:hypothetical protein
MDIPPEIEHLVPLSNIRQGLDLIKVFGVNLLTLFLKLHQYKILRIDIINNGKKFEQIYSAVIFHRWNFHRLHVSPTGTTHWQG